MEWSRGFPAAHTPANLLHKAYETAYKTAIDARGFSEEDHRDRAEQENNKNRLGWRAMLCGLSGRSGDVGPGGAVLD